MCSPLNSFVCRLMRRSVRDNFACRICTCACINKPQTKTATSGWRTSGNKRRDAMREGAVHRTADGDDNFQQRKHRVSITLSRVDNRSKSYASAESLVTGCTPLSLQAVGFCRRQSLSLWLRLLSSASCHSIQMPFGTWVSILAS